MEIAPHGGFFDQLEDRLDFTAGENDGEFLFDLDSCQSQDGPAPGTGDTVKELDRLVSDVDGAGLPVFVLGDKKQIISQLIFGGRIGCVPEIG